MSDQFPSMIIPVDGKPTKVFLVIPPPGYDPAKRYPPAIVTTAEAVVADALRTIENALASDAFNKAGIERHAGLSEKLGHKAAVDHLKKARAALQALGYADVPQEALVAKAAV